MITTLLCVLLGLSTVAFAQESMQKNNDSMGKKREMHSMNKGMAKKAMMKDGYIMKNGRMMVVKNGMTMRMEKAIMMPNGSTVKPNGELTTKDGKKTMLKNGAIVDKDGMVIKKNPAMKKNHTMRSMKKDDMKKGDLKKNDMMKKN